ncbi:MAG: hypothetical protein RML12_03215 [Xanthomonadales bacterium]|nr:hypothetical protein [Xanthomonadales bacterium]
MSRPRSPTSRRFSPIGRRIFPTISSPSSRERPSPAVRRRSPTRTRSRRSRPPAASRLAAAGLTRYEVSAFARPGAASRHNLNYWRFGDYLGIGAGAHGKLSFPGQDRILRLVKQPHPGRYLETAAGEERLAERREVTRRERIFEFLLNALRLTEGFPLALFEERTGLARGALLERAAPLAGRGLLELEGERLRPSARGLEVLNELLAAFLD